MDQATANKIAPETQVRPDPITDLVQHLTLDTSAKLKAFLLPPKEGMKFAYPGTPFVYRVGYINHGSLKFSSEFYGLIVPEGIMRPGGAIETKEPQEK